MFGQDSFTQKQNYIFTFCVIVVTCGVSNLFPNIKAILSLLGGVVAIQMGYTLPMIMQVALSKKKWYAWNNLRAILFFGTLILIGLSSGVVTFIEIF